MEIGDEILKNLQSGAPSYYLVSKSRQFYLANLGLLFVLHRGMGPSLTSQLGQDSELLWLFIWKDVRPVAYVVQPSHNSVELAETG